MARRLPGANLDVGLKLLGGDPQGPYWMAVVFPAGFHRPGGPAIDITEGYFVLQGELRYSGVVSPRLSYTVIPPGAPRTDTRTDEPTVAVARFSRQPTWSESGSPEAGVVDVHIPAGPPVATRLGPGWDLGDHDGVGVVLLESPLDEPVPVDTFVLSLADGTAHSVAAGTTPPDMEGPVGAWYCLRP